MTRNFFVFFFTLYAFFAHAQQPYYTNPVKIPMLLSGSFGELRNNHFHSGIDIKTQGKINIPVYAVAEGYISTEKNESGRYFYTQMFIQK